jgi:hypothetical protein
MKIQQSFRLSPFGGLNIVQEDLDELKKGIWEMCAWY